MTKELVVAKDPINGDYREGAPLYARPVPSKRTGAIYNAFSYPTKIDAEAVALFIAGHTKPGDTVLDVFGGSGSTGIAARLCDRPTDRMIQMADDIGLTVEWGPRNAVIYELSSLGSLLAEVMCNPPDPHEFRKAALSILSKAEEAAGWMYETVDSNGQPGSIRYIIWTEVLSTPCCESEVTLWDATVTLDPVVMAKTFSCPSCKSDVAVADCARVTIKQDDIVTGKAIEQRKRVPARIYGQTGKKTWSRDPVAADIDLVARIQAEPLKTTVPSDKIQWGDLYRSGYHTGIERFYHLYTPRNLRAIAELWSRIGRQPARLRPALRLLVLSYNATHSSLLTRVVAKKNKKDFSVTGAQSGVLYISGLPVEKNVFEGVRRKVETFAQAFELTADSESKVRVVNGSSTNLDLEDNSVDYVFTDPPFGDFIPYAEVNQVNEAWLGRLTDRTNEAIVSPSQGKGVNDYARLIGEVFGEVSRVVKPAGGITVVFHASKPVIWQALGDAFQEHGLIVERTSVLDKTQVSFKQVVHEGGTRGDAVFLLRPYKPSISDALTGDEISAFTDVRATIKYLRAAADGNAVELTPRRLYSRYVARCLELGVSVECAAPEFYALVSASEDSGNLGVV